MQNTQRLKRELAKITAKPPPGISLHQKDDKIQNLQAIILGPENTPYENGTFNLEITIPDNYPFCPPSIKFQTKIYHPNIDDSGRICLDLMKMPPQGSWKPTMGIEGLLIAIRMLLESPNSEDPLMIEIAEEYRNNVEQFRRKAKLFTEKYAQVY